MVRNHKLFGPRRFGGKVFERTGARSRKDLAQDEANSYRRAGHNARVVKVKLPNSPHYEYAVFVRRKKR